MFGFLNLFLAAAFAQAGMMETDLAELLTETNLAAFRFDADAAHWRTRRLYAERVAEARRHFALSFGSCSFDEPIADLKRLKLLSR
jgi:hypothetical protein